MAFKIHLIGDAGSDDNQYFDGLTAVRAAMGGGVLDEFQTTGGGYPVSDDVHIRILELVPPDAALPPETLTHYIVPVGLNRRLVAAYKDDAGNVFRGNIRLLVP